MIANTFIKRPVTAIVISLVLMISGIICIANLAVDQYPNITPPAVSISGQYTGADAQTVEQTVATPIEEQVNGHSGHGVHAEHQHQHRVDGHHRHF